MNRTFIFRLAIALVSLAIFNGIVSAQRTSGDGVWESIDKKQLAQRGIDRPSGPVSFEAFRLNKPALNSMLERAPKEFSGADALVLTLPMPDKSFARFEVHRSPIAEPKLLAEYPELGETYSGQGIDDPTATIRFDFLPTGFHGIVLSANDTVYISPYENGNTVDYISFYHNKMPAESFATECSTAGDGPGNFLSRLFSYPDSANVISGSTLRTYRLAVAATAEYTQVFGGNTVAGALSSITTTINLMDAVYEREIAVRLILVGNNSAIIFTDPVTDGYTHDVANTMLNENQARIDALIGSANYDVGHVFDGVSLGGGFSFQGVAQIASICGTGKARGVDIFRSVVPGDIIAYYSAAHEFGHQFGATHTMNGTGTGCSSARTAGTAYEPASGSTIMGYRWNCGAQDLRSSDVYFHNASLEQVVATTTAAGCGVQTPTGNREPVVNAGGNFTIPANTPFALTAAATDPDGDPITYSWEEADLGPLSPPDTDADGQARPIFRSFPGTTNPTRTFPSLTYILNNANVPPTSGPCPIGGGTCALGEAMPTITRTMNFRVTVRDNRSVGALNSAAMQVNVNAGAGPFAVTSPNTNVTYAGNSIQTVTWNAAGTASAPVNAANVKISYSSDGGITFPTVLAANTPNDGSQEVIIPVGNTTAARIKVEAVGNIFFDISNTNFTVSGFVAPVSHPVSDFDGDGKTDVSVWRESNGIWFVTASGASPVTPFQFGSPNDRIVPGDYDGDGKADMAVWRPAGGLWYLQRSSSGFSVTQWGVSTDIPVQGDFDGDGRTDIAVWRPSSGIWFIINSGNGQVTASQFGVPEDRPVAADYDGDGKTDLAVYRPSSGIWFLQRSTQGFTASQFGISTDKVVPGDYDGDGRADLAVYRDGPQALWYLQRSTAGFLVTQFGTTNDVPVAGDYDGDGKSDIAVWRPSNGIWFEQRSTSGLFAVQFGQIGDKPTPANYLPIQ